MGKQARIKAQKRRDKKLKAAINDLEALKEATDDNCEDEQTYKQINKSDSNQQEKGNDLSKTEIENKAKLSCVDEKDISLVLEGNTDKKFNISDKEIEEVSLNTDEVEEKSKLPDKQIKELDYAEISFRRNIAKLPPHHTNLAGLLFNLSLTLEKKGLYLQALEYSNEAVELAPDRALYKQANNRIKQAASQFKGKIDPIVEAERIRIAEKYYEERQTELARRNQKETEEGDRSVNEENIISLNKYAGNMQRNSYIETKLFYSNAENITKPIFNSKAERIVYTILIEQFPNHLVYPNMALQNIFDFDKVKEILDSYDVEYFLKAHVDFCIIKTSDYYPLLTIELDSHHHDDEETKKKDEIKNQLFQQGGMSLLRVRPFERPSEETIRAGVIQALEAWRQNNLKATSTNGPSALEQ